jgi:hypothetical protein
MNEVNAWHASIPNFAGYVFCRDIFNCILVYLHAEKVYKPGKGKFVGSNEGNGVRPLFSAQPVVFQLQTVQPSSSLFVTATVPVSEYSAVCLK